jgi:membrane protein YdbS with pleckstrin-like domain
VKKNKASEIVERLRKMYEKESLPVNAIFAVKPSFFLVIMAWAFGVLGIILLARVNALYVPLLVTVISDFFKGVKPEWVAQFFALGIKALYAVIVLLVLLYTVRRQLTVYVLTNEELMIKKGLFFRQEIYIPLVKAQYVNLKSSLFGLAAKYGTIYIDTGGFAGEITMENVVMPRDRVREIIDNIKLAGLKK